MFKITHHASLRITRFFEKKLRVKLKNSQWSYGGLDTTNNCVFLKVWVSEQKKNGRFEVYWKGWEKSNGGKERWRHLEAVRRGAKCFGVLGEFVNSEAKKVRIKTFDDEQLLLLGNLRKEKEGCITAQVLRRFPIDELAALVNDHVGSQNSAIDDIPLSMPAGSTIPSKTQSSSSRYQRDDKVRRFVIEQAKGVCEYCCELGFLLPDGSHYLEAHHIISLAKQGPDTVKNVIALCPSDHREAHYGAKKEAMEKEMIKIIRKR